MSLTIEAQQWIFYVLIAIFIIVVFVIMYYRQKQIERQRIEGIEPSMIFSGEYAIFDTFDHPLDPYAFNPVVIDNMRLETSGNSKENVDRWYIAIAKRGERASEVCLLKPDHSESLCVSVSGMLRTEQVKDSDAGDRSVWILSRVGNGWALRHAKTGLYLSWSDLKVGLKPNPDSTCVIRIRKYEVE